MRTTDLGASAPEQEATAHSWESFASAVLRRAAQQPTATALVDADGATSYAELGASARRVAGALNRAGVRPGDRVGVALPRSARTVVVLLGVLLAGAAYVPLDPTLPLARRRRVVTHATCRVVVDVDGAAGDHPERRALTASEVLCGPEPDQLPHLAPGTAAYVLFTSGSTGEPKGVEVTHGNVGALLAWATTVLAPEDVAMTGAAVSFGFDPSVLEVFATLVLGGTLRVLDDATDPALTGAGVTFFATTPSVVQELARADRLPPTLRTVVVGGEALSAEVAHAVLQSRPHLRLLHAYGPTETTVLVTCQELRGLPLPPITLGHELPGSSVRILTPDGHEAPAGESGEVCIAGEQVARGYVGDPEQTGARFVTWTTPEGAPLRLYRSGDRGRRLPTGELEFLGRIDRQAKIRGFRVELEEVERALLAAPGVAQAAVVVRGAGATARLAAVVVLAAASTEDVLASAAAHLPRYMIPSAVHVVTSMPTTSTGKVDVAALAAVTDAVVPGPRRPAPALTGHELVVAEEVAALLGLPHAPEPGDDVLADLGCTSLQLLQLAGALERALGITVAIDDLLDDTTVGGIAARLDAGRGLPGAREATGGVAGLTWLDAGATGTPLVLMHLYVGGLLKYRALRGLLRRPVLLVGVQPCADSGPGLQEAAAQVVPALRAQIPHGPYLLGGHSAGGLLALEVARQLASAGDEVPVVVLIDTPVLTSRAAYWWGELAMHLPELVHGSWAARKDKLDLYLAKRSRRWRTARAGDGAVADVLAREGASNAAVACARPGTYDGAVTVLSTRQGRIMARGRADLGWRRHVRGPLAVRRVSGLHNSVFDAGAQVTELAGAIDDALARGVGR